MLSLQNGPGWPLLTGRTLATAVVVAVWFALVVLLGMTKAFVAPPGALPLAIALGVTLPVGAFIAALWLSQSFREFVLVADLRLLLAIQAWRFAGFGFLALYTYQVLPGLFAWPAGLGDIAIGLTAPWLLVALIRRPDFAATKTFVGWNLFGVLDLVVAVGTGALGSVLATGAAGEITTRPMAELPLVLIPGFLVPLFIMLHVAALLQARRLARGSAGRKT
jgi:hypothetical protein